MSSHILTLLEQLRKTADTGRRYAESPYDIGRYSELLAIADQLYQSISAFDITQLDPVDQKGYITPKVGVNGIIEQSDGKILLEQRVDDKCWGIPGGWAEPGLTAEENVIKELKEETGFDVKVTKMIGIISRKPSAAFPFTSYHILYQCEIISGALTCSHESEAVAWKDTQKLSDWHFDHQSWIEYYHKMK